MIIEGQSSVYFSAVHYDERDAIRKRVALVWTLLKTGPPGIEECFRFGDNLNHAALAEPVSDFHSLLVTPSTIEKRDRLVEDVGCRDDRRECGSYLSPVPCGLLVVLVVRDFDGDQIASIQKDRGHPW